MIGCRHLEGRRQGTAPVKDKRTYSRKVSSEEAQEDYLLVLKSNLQLFPHLRKEFDLVQNHVAGKAKVESYTCTCRWLELPHEHYFIRWKGLRPKDKVEIREDSRTQGRYLIHVRR
jgi:hypothetical protein